MPFRSFFSKLILAWNADRIFNKEKIVLDSPPGIVLPNAMSVAGLGHRDFWPIYAEAERPDCMVAA